jgi:hypothetical protein
MSFDDRQLVERYREGLEKAGLKEEGRFAAGRGRKKFAIVRSFPQQEAPP